jgi:hypothetical protein
MPLFFFHIFDNGEIVRDEEGSDCPDLECAKVEAAHSAFDIAQEAAANGLPPDGTCVEIQDRDGRVLAALTVAEVLKHPGAPEFSSACGVPRGAIH